MSGTRLTKFHRCREDYWDTWNYSLFASSLQSNISCISIQFARWQHDCGRSLLSTIGFDYFESGQRWIWPDLGTQIQPDQYLGTSRFWKHRTIRLMKLEASAVLSAAIKGQYSSVFPLLRHCLPVFLRHLWNGNGFSIFPPSNTN